MLTTAISIEHLAGLKGTSLAYQLSPGLPVEDAVVGPVQVGSPLPHPVSVALSFHSSSLLQNVLKICKEATYKPNFMND